ncbi:extracellular solute-binding protein [Jiangella rhizosphaerae]|uniref:Extracellular solute-binding protein n=1 Tax=Jiangella rhizosphaerae TaxID=2293569 RepID=A0A418KM38_9ACTN|nr:extracellular solute-binding protein [Jiangella rhizosphaerae]RIQ19007.1 extracellular solute-binding protein [Jiangella rhizosphaerae]
MTRVTRKTVALLAAATAATLTVGGCSATSGGTEPDGGESAGPGDGEIEFWTINLKEGYQAYIEGLIDTYEADHEGVTVTWVDVSDYQQTQTRLISALTSGDIPDVVNVTPFILPLLADNGTVLPIGEITDDVEDIAAEYTEGFWDAGVIDGEPYAVPYYGSGSALLYNKGIFEAAGLDPDQPPTTWAEVFEYARRIHERTGLAGFVHTLDDFNDAGNTADILASQAGVPLLDEDGTAAAFNTPEAVEHVQNYVDGVAAGWISGTSVNGTTLDGAREFAQGQVAMMFNGPWLLRWIEANASAEVVEQIGLAPHPESPTGYANAFLQQFAIPAGSDDPALALDFARYVSGTVIELAAEAPVLPTLKADVEDPAYLELFGADVLTSQPIRFFWPKHPDVAKLLESLRQNLQAALLGEVGVAEALDAAATEWNGLLAD